ncbi:MAG: hypothetical protein MR304_06795 [Eubacterium sp.]|nr:hypothetical protein [Eubacterium sp.]
MKVAEARSTYSAQLRSYNEQKFKLAKQKQELDEKIKTTENGSVIYANEAATLELVYNAVEEKQNEYQEYMDQLMGQWNAKFNEVASKQQADAAKEYGEEMGKLITVARRIMHGDIVPQSDEKKLMEFDRDLYQMAKNIGMLAKMKDKKEYDSLWDEEKKEYEDPMEAANEEEAFASGPEIVSVEDTIAAAAPGEETPSES